MSAGADHPCTPFREQLLELAQGGELPAVAGHAAGCDRCGAELARLRRVVELVAGLPQPEPTAGLTDQVVAVAQVAAVLDALPAPEAGPEFTAQVLDFARVAGALDQLSQPEPSAGFTERVMAEVRTPEAATATSKPEGGPIRLRDYARQRARRAPGWVMAISAHAAALLIFATIVVSTMGGEDPARSAKVDTNTAETAETDDPDPEPISSAGKPPVIQPIEGVELDPEFDFEDDELDGPKPAPPTEPGAAPTWVRPVIDPHRKVRAYLEKERQIRTQVAAWMGSRTSDADRAAADAAAGTQEWSAAVARGLAWLRSTQRQDGTWDPTQHGGQAEHRLALTALATLAFAAEGHSPGSASDDSNRQRVAARWMGEQQDEDSGRIGPDDTNHMYGHGIALCALAELHALDLAYHWSIKNSDLRSRVRLGVRYLAQTQNADGGWGYRPGAASDTSITVWQIAALKTAVVLGIEQAKGPLAESRSWLHAVAHKDGRFGYQRRGDFPKGAPALAAAGAWGTVCATAVGSSQTIASRTALLLRNVPGGRAEPDRYAWYYATLVMRMQDDAAWGTWRDALGRKLLDAQRPDGHWASNGDKFGTQVGRLYTTTLSLLALQTPHRFVLDR